MTKSEEKKLRTEIKKLLGENYEESDNILITELVDWIKISNKAKTDLAYSVDEGAKMDWQSLTTISMSAKQIINILKSLGITPNDRIKQKLMKKVDDENAIDNLTAFING